MQPLWQFEKYCFIPGQRGEESQKAGINSELSLYFRFTIINYIMHQYTKTPLRVLMVAEIAPHSDTRK